MSESFWDFSIRTYGNEQVPQACLALQNDHGVDVNVLLYCCWYGITRGSQDIDSFNEILSFSESWAENVVKPLRGVRSWMKSTGCVDSRVPTEACMSYREKVKGTELAAEKMQQEVLSSLSTEKPKDMESNKQLLAVADNVHQYFVLINVELEGVVLANLATIIQAAMGDVKQESIVDIFTNR